MKRHLTHACAWGRQMVVPTSDLDTLAKVDVSAFNVTTYAAAFSKQVRSTSSHAAAACCPHPRPCMQAALCTG